MIAHAYAAGGHRNNLVVGERGPAQIIRDQLWIKRAGAIALHRRNNPQNA